MGAKRGEGGEPGGIAHASRSAGGCCRHRRARARREGLERRPGGGHAPARERWLSRGVLLWMGLWTFVCGVLGAVWLVLRSGPKPDRLAYPCQQAALSAATLAFGAPVVAAVVSARRRLGSALRTPRTLGLALLLLLVAVAIWGQLSPARSYQGTGITPPAGYRADVFHITNCPQQPVGTHFPGLDQLILLMGSQGLRFYQHDLPGLTQGPDGIVAADDLVIIKINYQWPQRGGTNVDLLRGLVARITEHPGGFTGEIAICENTQTASVDGFDRLENNAEDPLLSPLDVVLEFQAQGVDISLVDWSALATTGVDEFSDGDLADGYVVGPFDTLLWGRVSYPKFTTTSGTPVSLAHGIWDPVTATYDRSHLCVLNVPVLKSHHNEYGATACIKNTMGIVTKFQGTNSHSAIANGILGAVLATIQPPDVNILDCIWVNANPLSGPWTSYSVATRRDELVAGVDPVATDRWAVANVLIPAFIASGHSAPWPSPSADPDLPDGAFRNYLDHSLEQLLLAGFDVTNDPASIDAYEWDGTVASDCNGDGIPDAWQLAGNDCDGNGVPDDCDIAAGTLVDADGDGIPDSCCIPFVRGDTGGDGQLAIDDAIGLLDYLFNGGPTPIPAAAGDVNADGATNIADAAYLLDYLFDGGAPPPAPFPTPDCAP